MRDPKPANLTTPEESRARGWAAEARDNDGHLISQHAPFDNDAHLIHYVREAMDDGWTVTIWPVAIRTPPMKVAVTTCGTSLFVEIE